MAGDPQPEQVAVQPLQLRHDDPDIGGAAADLHTGQLLHRLAERSTVGMGANAADTLDDIHILDIGPGFAGLFQTAVVIADAHHGIDDLFPLQGDGEAARLLQGRVLRSNGDGDLFVAHSASPPSTDLGGL